MNGKKAKILRGLAGVKPEAQENRSYHGVESNMRNRILKDPLGNVVHRFTTTTYQLNAGPRVLYKMLKKAHKKNHWAAGKSYQVYSL
jgi:hypothetical protein